MLFFYLLVCVVSSHHLRKKSLLIDINSVVVFAVSCCNKVEIQQRIYNEVYRAACLDLYAGSCICSKAGQKKTRLRKV